MKKIIARIIPERLLRINREYKHLKERMASLEETTKKKWLLDKIGETKDQKKNFELNEYKIYSQNGEDGIINYIFSKVGLKDKLFVEIGIEDGTECNAANLVLNFGCRGLMLEGNLENVNKARGFYKEMGIRVIHSFVDRENINEVISKNLTGKEIDFLSLDIDGNDYWIWDKIDCISPRVVVLEYNPSFGDKSIAIKYDPKFDRYAKHSTGFYYGASLTALTKLSRIKGYILVGECAGTNAFFIRRDVAKNKFKELSVKEVFKDNEALVKKFGEPSERFNIIKDLEYERI